MNRPHPDRDHDPGSRLSPSSGCALWADLHHAAAGGGWSPFRVPPCPLIALAAGQIASLGGQRGSIRPSASPRPRAPPPRPLVPELATRFAGGGVQLASAGADRDNLLSHRGRTRSGRTQNRNARHHCRHAPPPPPPSGAPTPASSSASVFSSPDRQPEWSEEERNRYGPLHMEVDCK